MANDVLTKNMSEVMYMHVLLTIWLLIGGLIGGLVQIIFAFEEDEDFLSFNHAFWFAKNFYLTQKDKLNCAGLIIGITFISVFILPVSILVILIAFFIEFITKLWDLFAYVFKKKS